MTTVIPSASRLRSALRAALLAAAAFTMAAQTGLVAPAEAGKAGVNTDRAGQRVKLGLNKSVVIDLPADAYDK